MILRCVHCGPYELTPEQESIARGRSVMTGIQCFRCNEEAKTEPNVFARVDDSEEESWRRARELEQELAEEFQRQNSGRWDDYESLSDIARESGREDR